MGMLGAVGIDLIPVFGSKLLQPLLWFRMAFRVVARIMPGNAPNKRPTYQAIPNIEDTTKKAREARAIHAVAFISLLFYPGFDYVRGLGPMRLRQRTLRRWPRQPNERTAFAKWKFHLCPVRQRYDRLPNPAPRAPNSHA